MNKYTFLILLLFTATYLFGQNNPIDKNKIQEDLNEILQDLENNYIYLDEKKVDLACIKKHYNELIAAISTESEAILCYEYLLDEFYDSHLILNTNISASFRLYAPIYAATQKGKSIITNVWQNQINPIPQNIIGAEILKFNHKDFQAVIDAFPTHCNDKSEADVRTWIANKVIAGRYNEARILTLKLPNQSILEFDLDQLLINKQTDILESKIVDNIGIITINNALGNPNLITKFDAILDSLFNTKGLIIDLRNTISGGDSYIARAILGRFISQQAPYQQHSTIENYGNHPPIERTWIEYVSPRNKCYEKPVIILVGRWTGSMGEGLAIGFEGMERATVLGTKMARLAGAVNGFSFIHNDYGYQISTEKLLHINGTPREKYIPTKLVEQTRNDKDEALAKAILMLDEKN